MGEHKWISIHTNFLTDINLENLIFKMHIAKEAFKKNDDVSRGIVVNNCKFDQIWFDIEKLNEEHKYNYLMVNNTQTNRIVYKGSKLILDGNYSETDNSYNLLNNVRVDTVHVWNEVSKLNFETINAVKGFKNERTQFHFNKLADEFSLCSFDSDKETHSQYSMSVSLIDFYFNSEKIKIKLLDLNQLSSNQLTKISTKWYWSILDERKDTNVKLLISQKVYEQILNDDEQKVKWLEADTYAKERNEGNENLSEWYEVLQTMPEHAIIDHFHVTIKKEKESYSINEVINLNYEWKSVGFYHFNKDNLILKFRYKIQDQYSEWKQFDENDGTFIIVDDKRMILSFDQANNYELMFSLENFNNQKGVMIANVIEEHNNDPISNDVNNKTIIVSIFSTTLVISAVIGLSFLLIKTNFLKKLFSKNKNKKK